MASAIVVTDRSSTWRCPLCSLIKDGKLEEVRKVIQAEQDVCQCQAKQPVYRVIKFYQGFLKQKRSDNMLKALVWKSPEVYTSLTRASVLEVTAKLLAGGAGINYTTGVETPLMAALSTCDEELLWLLLDFKADANLCDGVEDMNALGLAILLNEVSLVEMLLKHGAKVNTLCCGNLVPIQLAMNKNSTISNLLIQYGADVHQVRTVSLDDKIFTCHSPLHVAILRKNVHLGRLLLEHGEDVNQTFNDTLESPIHQAVRNLDLNMIDLLIEFGADLNRPNFERHTPIGLSLIMDDPIGTEIAKRLIIAGASANQRTRISFFQKTYSPLHIACFKGNLRFVKFLVEEVCGKIGYSEEESQPSVSKSMTRKKVEEWLSSSEDSKGSQERYFKLLPRNERFWGTTPSATPNVETQAPSSSLSGFDQDEEDYHVRSEVSPACAPSRKKAPNFPDCACKKNRNDPTVSFLSRPTSRKTKTAATKAATESVICHACHSDNTSGDGSEHTCGGACGGAPKQETKAVFTFGDGDETTSVLKHQLKASEQDDGFKRCGFCEYCVSVIGETKKTVSQTPVFITSEANFYYFEEKDMTFELLKPGSVTENADGSFTLESGERVYSAGPKGMYDPKDLVDFANKIKKELEYGDSESSTETESETCANAQDEIATDIESTTQDKIVTDTQSNAQEKNGTNTKSNAEDETATLSESNVQADIVTPTQPSSQIEIVTNTQPSSQNEIVTNTRPSSQDEIVTDTQSSSQDEIVTHSDSSSQGEIVTNTRSNTEEEITSNTPPDSASAAPQLPVFQSEFGSQDYDYNSATENRWQHLFVKRVGRGEEKETKSHSVSHFLNQMGTDGSTALFMAVYDGNVELVDYLLMNGANPHFSSHHGNFLHAAVLSQSVPLIRRAIDLGCDINEHNMFGNSPLTLVSRLDLPEACRMLVEHGADLNSRDRYRETPLLASVYFGCELNARLLIQHGASLNLVDDNHTSAIYWSIFNNRQRTLMLLLLAGASFTPQVFRQYPRNIRIMNNKPLFQFIQYYVHQPRSLQDLAMVSIRVHMGKVNQGRSILKDIDYLPIPTRLKSVLRLEHFIEAIDAGVRDPDLE